MAKAMFHVGPSGPGPCGATVGKCPWGGDSGIENHFSTQEEASKAFAEKMKADGFSEFGTTTERTHFNSGKKKVAQMNVEELRERSQKMQRRARDLAKQIEKATDPEKKAELEKRQLLAIRSASGAKTRVREAIAREAKAKARAEKAEAAAIKKDDLARIRAAAAKAKPSRNAKIATAEDHSLVDDEGKSNSCFGSRNTAFDTLGMNEADFVNGKADTPLEDAYSARAEFSGSEAEAKHVEYEYRTVLAGEVLKKFNAESDGRVDTSSDVQAIAKAHSDAVASASSDGGAGMQAAADKAWVAVVSARTEYQIAQAARAQALASITSDRSIRL